MPESYYVVPEARLNKKSRDKKLQKILSVIKQYADIGKCNVLDVGTSAGYIASELGKKAKSVTSIDINDERKSTDGYKFIRTKDALLPVKDNSFDVVISNHVVEHVPDQKAHFMEIKRVLKSGGIAYLATPNKYWLLEPHYKLPLLSWPPRAISKLYLRLMKRKDWNIYPLSTRGIRRLAKDAGLIVDQQTHLVLKNPKKYHVGDSKVLQATSKTPLVILKALSKIAPAHIVILRK